MNLNEKELLLLQYLEGDLDDATRAKAEALMAEDAMLEMDYNQLAKTKLVPDTAIVYSGKNSLKRPVTKEKTTLGFIIWPLSIAASLALLLLFYNPQYKALEQGVAVNTEKNAPVHKNGTTPGSVKPGKIADNNLPGIKPNINVEQVSKNTHPVAKQAQETKEYKVITETSALALHTVTIPKAETAWNEPVMPEIKLPGRLPETAAPVEIIEAKKGWLATAQKSMNNLLGYLKKPQLSIDKKENNDGRDYWAIIIESDKYEVEGRLYSPGKLK